MTIDKSKIRNAATVIVIRDRHTAPRILMGQRGATAAFMPNKFVFPGGAVDLGDAQVPLASMVDETCQSGQKGAWEGTPPADWLTFAQRGYLPHAAPLQFVFRALTPPGRPRRFDARFFLVDAEDIATDLDNFDDACDELSHLQWVALSDARKFDMPFITEVVLAEVEARARQLDPPASVPFFKNNDEESLFLRLRGRPMPS